MEELIKVTYDENYKQPAVSSLQIAEDFGKQHKDVLETIRKMTAENSALLEMFYETTYKSIQNKKLPMYLMNRDGFSLLVMGFTGKDALDWKLKYINAFNAMEKAIANPQIDVTKQKEVEARYMNAKARIASMWMKLANRVPSNTEYQQICNSYASEALTGEKVLPLPKCDDCYYTATEVGALLGISSKKVGSISKQHDLKNEENGKWFFDKSPYSNKEVETYKYNQKGIDAIKAVVDGGAK